MKSVLDEAAYAVFFSIILNVIWMCGASMIASPVDAEVLLRLVAPGTGEAADLAAVAVGREFNRVLLYFATLLPISAALGYASHAIVRACKWDHKIKALRFNNYWYYLLTGEMALFPDSDMSHQRVDGVYLSAVVDCQLGSILYRGIVKDFTFDQTGELDTILLVDAHRRLLSDDLVGSAPRHGNDDRYYSISGDLFLLKYREIKTLNLDYFYFEDDPVLPLN